MAKKQQTQPVRFAVISIVVVTAFLLMHSLYTPMDEISEIQYSDLVDTVALDKNSPRKIKEVTFKGEQIFGVREDNTKFKTYGPSDPDIRQKLMDAGVIVKYEPQEDTNFWRSLIANFLFVIVLIFIFMFLFRQIQGGGSKAFSFGKSKARFHSEGNIKTRFSDVAGVDEAKEEHQEIIDFLKEPKKFTRLGGRIPKGVLLVGPPGTGKTILAKAIAGEANVPFFSISGSDFVEMFVGVGASRVRDMFDQAKKNAPCIVFIDEIDAVGRHRGTGLGGGHDEREQTLNQLLVEMDGFEVNEGVILIAATNRVDVLDPALLRPGRFDRRVTVPLPDILGREAILKVHSRKTPLASDVNLKTIAQGTPGFSGADLENLVNEAALIAAKENKKEVSAIQFERAKDKVLMGPERKSMVIGEKEKKTTAYHEAGHAIVAKHIEYADPIHKVSIIPRGQALGVTILLPSEDRLSTSKEQAEAMIAYAMGGRAAEELMFNHYTTGASNDIKKATEIARNMVCRWGMSEKIGPVNFGKTDHDPFLGRDFSRSESYSEKIAQEIDQEISSIIFSNYTRALDILTKNKELLDRLAAALIEYETLSSSELDDVFSGRPIQRVELQESSVSRSESEVEIDSDLKEEDSDDTDSKDKKSLKTRNGSKDLD